MTSLAMPPSQTSAKRPGVATLELEYLRPALGALPGSLHNALDIGAHAGDVSLMLAEMGWHVLAVEPQDYMADRLSRRLASHLETGAVKLARCAASNKPGMADLMIGSASTISTLEPLWTSVAFPEEFRNRRVARVPLKTAADLLTEYGVGPLGYAKIDVEGHELAVLQGLFAPGVKPPAVVMFEAHGLFAQDTLACLQLLAQQGYGLFDIFIRIGPDPIAGQRFEVAELPSCWQATGDRYFYANLLAYRAEAIDAVANLDPAAFTLAYQIDLSRDYLRKALDDEQIHPVEMNDVTRRNRLHLRERIFSADWDASLSTGAGQIDLTKPTRLVDHPETLAQLYVSMTLAHPRHSVLFADSVESATGSKAQLTLIPHSIASRMEAL